MTSRPDSHLRSSFAFVAAMALAACALIACPPPPAGSAAVSVVSFAAAPETLLPAGRAVPDGSGLLWPYVLSPQHVLERLSADGAFAGDEVAGMAGHLVAGNGALLGTQNGSIYRRADGVRVANLGDNASTGAANAERTVVTEGAAVVGLDGADGTEVWRIEGSALSPMLTNIGSALIAFGEQPVELREVDLVDGHTLWACTLAAPPDTNHLRWYATLADGYWILPTSSVDGPARVVVAPRGPVARGGYFFLVAGFDGRSRR